MTVATSIRKKPPRSAGAVVTEVRVDGRYAGGVVHMKDGTFEAWSRGRFVGLFDGLDAAVQALAEAVGQ